MNEEVTKAALENATVEDLKFLSVEEKTALLKALDIKKANFSITTPWTENNRLVWLALKAELESEPEPEKITFIAEKDRKP